MPRIIRDIYSGHIQSRHWDDVAYNFFVDKCGTIYEGRAGGSDRPVTGAHSIGFNKDTMGIAAIGTYDAKGSVPQEMAESIARIAAWKLGLSDIDPRGEVGLVSSSSKSRFKKGKQAVFHVIAGHRDAYMTDCPGKELYAELPEIRTEAARLQGRPRCAPRRARADRPLPCQRGASASSATSSPTAPAYRRRSSQTASTTASGERSAPSASRSARRSASG